MSERPAPANIQPKSIIGVTLRKITPEDDRFLRELYASTRAEELAVTGWDATQRDAFLREQFNAREASYHAMFPGAERSIILRDGARIGWWVVHHSPQDICLVNVALLPAYCGAGIGTALLAKLLAEATHAGLPVRLHVLKENRALRFYQRLGFRKCGEVEFYDHLEWRAVETRT